MKITRISAEWLHVPIPPERQHTSDFGRAQSFDTALVRIDTDEGLTGWGEAKVAAGSFGNYAGVVGIIRHELAPLLEGENALHINRLRDKVYNGTRAHFALARGHVFPGLGRRGLSIAALSGVDIALWDLLGKYHNAPVHQLLGGKRADSMPAYASGGWAPASGIGAQLQAFVGSAGFKAVKMRVGVQDGDPHTSAERVIAAREALGPGIDLMCDAHGTFTVSEAKQFCYLVRDCNVAWFEEPVTADDPEGLAEVRRSTHVPIAAGESEFTRYDFRQLIERRAVDIVQPDLAICGGISEALHISSLTSSANLRLAAHLWAGAPAFAAGLHLSAVSPAAFILEYSLGANPMLHDLIEEDFKAVDGRIAIPDRPGLGITPRPEFIAEHRVELGHLPEGVQ